jgi:hypothetical protein
LNHDLAALRAAWRARPFPVLIVREGVDAETLHAFVRPADLGWQDVELPAGTAGLQKAAAAALGAAIKAYPDVIDAGKIEIGLFTSSATKTCGMIRRAMEYDRR